MRAITKHGTHKPLRRYPGPLPAGELVCVGITLSSGARVGGCGQQLTGMRRNVCERCMRSHTAKKNPGIPISPGDGGRVVLPDVAMRDQNGTRLRRRRNLTVSTRRKP